MIHIVQCLCPSRHCIMAALYDPNDETRGVMYDPQDETRAGGIPAVRAAIDLAIAAKTIDPWCGICKAKSDTWRYEDSPTLWRTMAEALPAAKALEAANRATAAFLKTGRN